MKSPRRAPVAAEVLSRGAAERLLQRAAELDMARTTQLDTLRAAAAEAGIQPDAFEAALDEMHASGAATRIPERPRLQSFTIALGVAALLATGIATVSRVPRPSVATVE